MYLLIYVASYRPRLIYAKRVTRTFCGGNVLAINAHMCVYTEAKNKNLPTISTGDSQL